MQKKCDTGWSIALASLLMAVLAGCASPTRGPAPVEDRGAGARHTAVAPQPAADPARVLPGAENAGKPGYYTVRPGDTLIRIGLETGQNHRDLARWNSLDNPNLIEVGQVLRVVPTGSSEPSRMVTPVTAPSASAPAPAAVAASGPASAPASLPTAAARPVASAPSLPVINTPPASPGDDEIAWIWPVAQAPVLAGFDEQKNKGLDLGGKAGEPVLAAADGRVVYAGAGLRGYGNLIILKHNNTYLTAYAHNQTLLVKEDQNVRKGQKIAEMGATDTDRVKLHFEIRRQGKPVDPARYLPAR
ncbi:peptidoglycan DD-metalloendopeptidase family protein [Ramlibacter sp.]|uniref:peptidoglycan DD-metalloendopeptidase family protein n=1 Tax=Ramlibacter sp. TaxID=1917967 RepID=UPI0017B7EE7B|nr:peptidoglycan DD-metalloendopeptidase family protein [Ramlibacter sp.]MBA2673871.1 peptidoglycan DD-metalloendopeptidase family protein [Ramlibacter sp.]